MIELSGFDLGDIAEQTDKLDDAQYFLGAASQVSRSTVTFASRKVQ